MILAVALHAIENSDSNSCPLELPSAVGFSQNNASIEWGCGVMHGLLAAYADSVVFTSVMH